MLGDVMSNNCESFPQDEAPRGLGITPGRLFSWENAVLLGAVICLALSLLVYQYIQGTRLLICYVGLPISIVVFCILLKQRRLLRFHDMRLLLVLLAWILACCILNINRASVREDLPYVAPIFTVALLCYPLAHIVPKERRVKTFNLLAWLWVIPVVCTAIVAIALALSGTVLYRADGAPMGLAGKRLWFICDPNMYGILCCTALSLVFYLQLAKRRSFVRALLTLMAICLFAALSLTDCRSAKTALLIVAFFFAALPIWQLLHKKKKAVRLLAGGLGGAVFCIALAFGYRGVSAGMNRLIAYRDGYVKVAAPTESVQDDAGVMAAEDPETVAARGFQDMRNVDMRLGIWAYALGRVPDEWDVLLRGATPALVRSLFFDPELGFTHLHNAYLDVLLGYGIPGLIVLAVFILSLFTSLCRLLFSPRSDLPLQLRLLTGLVLAILAINFVESMLVTKNFISELDVWLMLIGGFAAAFSRDYAAVPTTGVTVVTHANNSKREY